MSSSGATLINVRRDVDDAFYRYKMPKLTAKVEGRGNGIKTVILNLIDVSKALARPPLYLLKYFGNEVGAQVIADEKNAKHILTGSHPVDTLQDILDTFIQRFVLCSSCGNPETDLVIGKDEMIDRVCKACGKASLVDMRHKIAAFILKNPPESLTSANAIAIQEYEADQDDELAELADLTLEDDEEASNALDELQSIDASQAEDRVREFIQGFPRPFCPDAVKALGKDLEIPDHLIVAITVQELFDGSMLSEGQIEQHASALCRLIGGVQRRELALLGGIERVISVHFPGQLLEKTSAVLARLYQSEVVSEEALEFWKENISKRYQAERKNGQLVREKAGVFFDWLATAAEEEEEQSEEESEAE